MEEAKKPFRKLAKFEFQPTHFTMEEGRRVVREVMEERLRREAENKRAPVSPGNGAVEAA